MRKLNALVLVNLNADHGPASRWSPPNMSGSSQTLHNSTPNLRKRHSSKAAHSVVALHHGGKNRVIKKVVYFCSRDMSGRGKVVI